jgi:hypothetical protein
MTILERISLDIKNTFMTVHEAPYHLTKSKERQEWKTKGKPCFNNEISQFWKMYCNPSISRSNVSLPEIEEQEERSRFIRYPITTLTEIETETKTLGGIWIDNVTVNRHEEKTAHIHIGITKNKRKLAYPLFSIFLESMKKNYSWIYVEWGARSPEDDPTNFFKNNGFQIRKTKWSNSATLELL